MQEDKDTPMVDIDTSGPGADIELNDDSQQQEEIVAEQEVKETPEVKDEDTSASPQEASDEKPEAKTEDQKDELETYSKDVQRRIAKLTKKWREAERQKEEAINYARIQKEEKETTLKKYSTLESSSVKEREARIQSAMLAAQAKLAAARETQDLASEVEAQKEIAKLGYEEARLMEVKQIYETRAAQKPVTIAETPIPQAPVNNFNPDPKAEDWGSRNKWFGTDKAMTYTAFDLHEKLVNEEGYDPQTDEYYAEIDKRIRLEFPHKFVTKEVTADTTKPTQIVAGAKRSVKPGRKTVRLTPSQVAIAKKLGVPLEEYAKQLKITKEV
jgi:GH15 family glucan-1,4-alpha-glucosidase